MSLSRRLIDGIEDLHHVEALLGDEHGLLAVEHAVREVAQVLRVARGIVLHVGDQVHGLAVLFREDAKLVL